MTTSCWDLSAAHAWTWSSLTPSIYKEKAVWLLPSKSFQSTQKIKNIQGHFIRGKKEAEKAGAAEV